MKQTIVLKFGGMSLSTPAHIKNAARRVANIRKAGHQVITVVSAMAKTTDELTRLAYDVSAKPNRRELDMLLSTGERVSMALFSMALTDALAELSPSSRAISFTGSQAGLLTDETHSNARIIGIKSFRVTEELRKGNVVILAGFQGVSPTTKEITTLGRGGTDVTAVAMAAAYHAERCEILKEVPGVMSADPTVVKKAVLLPNLTHQELLEMTFWGAKVLHYRSVELATTHQVPLHISLAHLPSESLAKKGTWVTTESRMEEKTAAENAFENSKILAINSHRFVRRLRFLGLDISKALGTLKTILNQHALPFPLLLHVGQEQNSINLFITAPNEALDAQIEQLKQYQEFSLDQNLYSSVTVTCQGGYATDLVIHLTHHLQNSGITCFDVLQSAMSITFVIYSDNHDRAIQVLHQQIED